MKGNKSAVRLLYTAAIFIASAVILCAVFAPLLAPYDPSAVSPEEILEHSSAAHWFGTDALGRDILSRVIYGARSSVAFAFCSAFCTMALGLSLGMVSGYFGGLADKSVQCLVALFQGLPGTSLMIAIAAILPENDFRIIIALTLTSWTGFSRIVRNEVLRIKGETYMEGIRSIGAGHWYILRKYVFPKFTACLDRSLHPEDGNFSFVGICLILSGTRCFSADSGLGRHDQRRADLFPLLSCDDTGSGYGNHPVLSVD